MKKIKLFFALFAMLALNVGNAWAETIFSDNFANVGNGSNTEIKTRDGWSGFSKCYAQGNSGLRLGSSNAGGSITKTAMSSISGTKDIKVTIYTSRYNTNANAFTISCVNGTISSITGVGTLSSGKVTISPSANAGVTSTTAGATWKDDFKTEMIISASSSTTITFATNKRAILGPVTIENASSTDEPGTEEPALSSIEISGDLTKKTYEEGDELDLTGLTVLANYESGDPKDVTNEVEWSYTPNPLTKGTTSVEVTATYEDKTATQTINGLTVNEHIITPDEYCIVPNNAFWGTNYTGTDAAAATTLSGKQNDISILHTKSGSNLYVNNTQTRVYTNHVMQISVPLGYVITSIAFTADGNNWAGTHTANVGKMTDSKNWAGFANEVTITFGGTCRITKICVNYIKDAKYVLTITEPAAGTGTLVVKDGENVLTSGAEIYEGTKLTVIATPETGYEEGDVVVKNASDEYVTADVYEAGTLTMPAYAVTISATFEKKPCELLAKPTVSAETTYNSATLTWDAVANAAKYSVTVGTADAVETTETSYEVTGLIAETEYTYQVQAIAETDQDTYCDSEVAEGSFTTSAAPVVTLTLKDIAGITTKKGALNSTITLPTEAAECSKTFVGWDANENCKQAPTYAKGAEYTLAEDQTLYAVYADGEGGGDFTITKTMSEIVDENEYTVSSGNTATCYTSLTLDENITLSTTGSANCGSFWNDPREWRLYQNKSGNAIVTATNGCSLTSVKFTFTYSNTGTLLNNGASMTSGTAVSASGTSATYTVGNSGSATNGQIRITAIEVSYSKEGEYSNYSTTCAAAAVATVNPTSVTATAAGVEGKVTVTYENVNTENVAVALFNDAACTEEFTADWLTASLDGDKNITYTVAATTLYKERKAYIQLTAPETTDATEPAVVVIPVTQAGKDKVFASLEALLAAITPTAEGVEVTVTLTNEVIQDFYTSGSYRNGIALNVPYQGGVKVIEIYCKDVPAEWVKGGKVSGTITCPWKLYNSTWELCPTAWTELTYTAPATVKSIAVSGTPTKTTYVDGEAFDPTGLVVTATLTDDSTEPIDVALVDWTFNPETLSKGETSVSVVATYNTMASAAYEVTGLTVNDIPTKTVAEFIAAGGTRCYLEGIVSGLTEGNSMKYGNFDLTDASGTIYVYGCLNEAGEKQKFAELGVKNGDKIKVIADEYELYDGTKDEAKNVQYVSHVSAATITIADITMEVEEVKTISATVEPAEAKVTYTIKENAADAISLSGNTITALKEGTATITATVAEGATYLGNSVDFTVTVGPKTESEEVVILAELGGKWYAMKGEKASGTGQIAALEVTYFNGTLYNVAESNKASITWTRTVVGDKVTFANNGKYLKGTSGDTNLALDGSKCEWTFNGTTYTIGNRTFLYRENFNFKNYNTEKADASDAQGNYSALPVVTTPVYETGNPVYTRTVTPGNYGTICLPYGSTEYSGATFFEIAYRETGKVYIDEVTTLEAGVPYIFQAKSATLTVTCDGEAVGDAGSANGLYGTFIEIADVAAVHADKDEYILTGGLIRMCESNCKVPANRAYIVLNEISTEKTPASVNRRRVGMTVNGENTETGVDNIITTDTPVKVIENGQLIIIRDGVKYNVQGVRL